MGKRKTPLILRLRENSGTMYIFPSATEDINLNLNNTSNGIALSHYALLNFPTLTRENMLMGYTPTNTNPIALGDGNTMMQVSLQNYMMNLETMILNDERYNFLDFNTVTERVFWKWFTKVTNKKYTLVKTSDNKIFYKNDAVTCFGKIDAENHLSTEFSMFNETYINVPTSYGGGPVYFKQRTDNILSPDCVLKDSTPNFLEGRDDTNTLNISYSNFNDVPFFDNNATGSYTFNVDNTTSLLGELLTSAKNDLVEIVKDPSTINEALNAELGKTIQVNTFDDINVDVNQQLKKSVVENGKTKEVSIVKDEFNFNAILLYYTIYDLNDSVKHAEAINLFGIIFLDGLKSATDTQDPNDFIIHPFVKRKSTSTNFGNSFSFRVNIKTLSIYDNTDAVIQDNTTMSSIDSVDFSDVISQLNRAVNIMNTNVKTTEVIQDEYAKMKSVYNDQAEKLNNLSHQLDAYINGNKSETLAVVSLTADNLYKNIGDQTEYSEQDNYRETLKNLDLSLFTNLVKVNRDKQLYLDPSSDLFNKTETSEGYFEYALGYTQDDDPILDYSAMIPLIMLKLQDVTDIVSSGMDVSNINNASVKTNLLTVNENAIVKNLNVLESLTFGNNNVDLSSLSSDLATLNDISGRVLAVESFKSSYEGLLGALLSLDNNDIYRLKVLASNDSYGSYEKRVMKPNGNSLFNVLMMVKKNTLNGKTVFEIVFELPPLMGLTFPELTNSVKIPMVTIIRTTTGNTVATIDQQGYVHTGNCTCSYTLSDNRKVLKVFVQTDQSITTLVLYSREHTKGFTLLLSPNNQLSFFENNNPTGYFEI